jgi:hypothetical protein
MCNCGRWFRGPKFIEFLLLEDPGLFCWGEAMAVSVEVLCLYLWSGLPFCPLMAFSTEACPGSV